MSIGVMIIGESGTGKSRSIKTLNPESTFLIKTLNKPLPFKGESKLYQYIPEKISDGNMYITLDQKEICSVMRKISANMKHIKSIVIDDYQFTMSELYFNLTTNLKLNEIFDVYRDIARYNKMVFECMSSLREDLNVYNISHSCMDESGFHKMKTIGKSTDKEYSLDAAVSIILHSCASDGEYKFLTQNDGKRLAKSPEEMFESNYIDNDLGMIDEKIREYFGNVPLEGGVK